MQMPDDTANTERVSTFLSQPTKAQAQRAADARGLKLSALIRLALLEWLRRHKS